MVSSKKVVPAAASIHPDDRELQKALAVLFSDLRQIAEIKEAAKAVANLLRKDAAALAQTRSEIERLGRELAVHFAALGPNTRLDDFTSKPLRMALRERYQELDRLVLMLRLLGGQDEWLVERADAVGDNTMRWIFVEALSGGQYGLPPVAPAMFLRWLDAKNDGARSAAQDALYQSDVSAAHARWRELLASSDDVGAVGDVLAQIEAHEDDFLPWASVLFRHLHTEDATLLGAIGRFVSLQPPVYRALVAHTLAAPAQELPRLLEVVADRLYWASLGSKQLLSEVRAPLLELRQRAAQGGLTKAVQRLDLALKKLGVKVETSTATQIGIVLGEQLASIGTEGGPPLAVPAAFVDAWQGVDGPEPFDSGNSDYERACDVSPPALIPVGKGQGLVLDQQHVSVHAAPDGLVLHAGGEPAEGDPKRWAHVGELEVGAGGLVVMDSALSAKRKSPDRATVPLAAGVYEVLAHRYGGFGNDFSAARLVRRGSAKATTKVTKSATKKGTKKVAKKATKKLAKKVTKKATKKVTTKPAKKATKKVTKKATKK